MTRNRMGDGVLADASFLQRFIEKETRHMIKVGCVLIALSMSVVVRMPVAPADQMLLQLLDNRMTHVEMFFFQQEADGFSGTVFVTGYGSFIILFCSIR